MHSAQALIGHQFANFRIVRLLGRGGMAEVYFGWDVKLQRPVAIKVIDARYREDPGYAQRFVNEARAMAAWNHPNIIPIHYADDEDGYYYYVMEYIHGVDLEQVLAEYARRQELVPWEDTVRVGRAAAAALDYAHSNGVVHRDVKPSNLLISAGGRVVLTDFGLAMHLEQGSLGAVFGSPHYIAPEQARNSSGALPQSDLYALGVILYEMLTGATPFDDPSPTALALQHLMAEPPPPRQINPGLSPAVEGILLKALRKSPEERYPSGRAMVDALESALSVPAQTVPFIPSASAIAETAVRPLRRISRLPVAEVVARHLEAQAAIPAGQEAAINQPAAINQHAAAPAWRTRLPAWWGIGCAALLVLVFVAVAATALAFNRPGGDEQARRLTDAAPGLAATWTSDAVVSSIAGATADAATPVDSTPIPAAPTANPEPAAASPATHTPAAEVLPTQPEPEITEPPAPAAPTSQPAATDQPEAGPPPAPPPAAGDPFAMYYDDTSFYIQNLSGKDRSIFPLAFERLEANGDPSNRFEGWRWGNIYPKFRAGYCLVLEILGAKEHLSPPECENRYLVIRTPVKDDETIFWTKDKGSKEFRVLWDGEEAGRCRINENYCEVNLP